MPSRPPPRYARRSADHEPPSGRPDADRQHRFPLGSGTRGTEVDHASAERRHGQTAVRTGRAGALTCGELERGDDGLVVRIGEHDLVDAAVDGEAVGQEPRVGGGIGARRAAVAAGMERLLFDQCATAFDLDDGGDHQSRQRGVEIDARRRPAIDRQFQPASLTLLVEDLHGSDELLAGAVGDHDRPTDVVDPGRRHTRAEPCLSESLSGRGGWHPAHGRGAEHGAFGGELRSRHHDGAGDRQQHDQ